MTIAGDIYNPWRVFVGCFIPNALVRSTKLSSTAKLVFGRLCQYAGENGQAYPTYNTLGREVGIERRQAIRAVKELEKFGLIRPIGRFRSDGGSTSNVYVFIWHEVFSGGSSSISGANNDAGGSVNNDTPLGCQKRHQRVSGKAPKENHTKERTFEETTTEQIRLLLSGTPLSEISEKGLKMLIKRHNIERLVYVADIAAETWRRERKEIRNPGGYLQALCESYVVPEWYLPLEERKAKALVAEELRLAAMRAEEKRMAIAEKEAKAKEELWSSLSETDRDGFRVAAKASINVGLHVPAVAVTAIAKSMAWENRSQMSNTGSLHGTVNTDDTMCNQ